MKFLRIFALFILCTLAVVVVRKFLPVGQKPFRCLRCNIVVIMIDNLRADSLPCYGYKMNTAPHICSFADQNLLFTRAFSASSWTLPSSMSFLTSLYPSSHGIGVTLYGALNPAITTLPEYLKNHGYDTTIVTTNQPSVGLYQGLETGFTKKILVSKNLDQSLPGTLDAIDQIKESNRNRKPSLLYIHSDGVHDYPNSLMKESNARFSLDPTYVSPTLPDVPFDETLREAAVNSIEAHLSFSIGSDIPRERYQTWLEQLGSAKSLTDAEKIFSELPEEDQDISRSHVLAPKLSSQNYPKFLEYMRHVYDDHIRQTDLYIGEILKQLKTNNLMRNTIVVISGEHGELLGEGRLIGHGIKMYNPEIHVPLIMHVPRVSNPTRITDLIQHIDVYPTLLDLFGAKKSDLLRGISFAPAIVGDPNGKKNSYVITEWTNRWQSKTIQNSEWKLFEDTPNIHGDTYELYHLTNDPKENDIVTPEYPEVADALQLELHNVLYNEPNYPQKPQPFPDWINEEHRKNLIETGYFNRP